MAVVRCMRSFAPTAVHTWAADSCHRCAARRWPATPACPPTPLPPPHPQPPTPNPLPHPPCSALVFEAQLQAYVPCGKEWIKKKAFTHLRRMADQAR